MHPSLDAYTPAEVAQRVENAGVAKARAPAISVLVLAGLAGAFISFGAIFYLVVTTGSTLGLGPSKLLGGLAFSLGLILVVVAGAELFTGNNLVAMAWASRRIRFAELVRNWVLVYIGNVVGAIATAALVYAAGVHGLGDGALGEKAVAIGAAKAELGFTTALARGVACNVLVCLAVWLAMAGRSVTDKVLAIVFPITAFVAGGFEHCVANMYFIPIAWLIKVFDPAFAAGTGVDTATITVGGFLLRNLLPVTIGNMIGGSIMVGVFYWSIFLRRRRDEGVVGAI